MHHQPCVIHRHIYLHQTHHSNQTHLQMLSLLVGVGMEVVLFSQVVLALVALVEVWFFSQVVWALVGVGVVRFLSQIVWAL